VISWNGRRSGRHRRGLGFPVDTTFTRIPGGRGDISRYAVRSSCDHAASPFMPPQWRDRRPFGKTPVPTLPGAGERHHSLAKFQLSPGSWQKVNAEDRQDDPAEVALSGPPREQGVNAAACFDKSIFSSGGLSRLPASGLGHDLTHG
jgi:hypothetical protein